MYNRLNRVSSGSYCFGFWFQHIFLGVFFKNQAKIKNKRQNCPHSFFSELKGLFVVGGGLFTEFLFRHLCPFYTLKSRNGVNPNLYISGYWIYSCEKIVKWLVGAIDKWFLPFRLHYRETDRLRWQIHSCQGQSGNKSKRSGRLRKAQPASSWSLLLVLSPCAKALLPPSKRFRPNTLRWGCIWKQWMWKKLSQ